ncbi:MAG: DUF2164 domain-containing protein [Dehalococcoidia bacterium]
MDAIELTKEEREYATHRLKAYFVDERDEEIGDLAAYLLYDFIAKELGPLFFNRGLYVAGLIARRGADTIEADIDAAKRMPPGGRYAPAVSQPDDED